ncbi:right-handed parallel beta-helix repeat-containing protein, partial [Paenibacillus nasutitermitis]|uniref:right-handed parallel beta-helix repeat-containing protein n=1 Tax=Paenibacillus nasutitermitis TaxID=1652958 RepID=UPI00166D7181
MKRIKSIFAGLMSMFLLTGMLGIFPESAASASAQHTFFASTDGSGAICSQEAPCTLVGARDKVRTVNGNMAGDIVVYLRGGVYPLSETLVFDQRDSGTNGYNVIYKSFPGEKASISGGREISGWTPIGGAIYKTNVGTQNFRQLYINGRSAVRARTPNAGEYRVLSWDTSGKRINIDSSNIANWKDFAKTELILRQDWTMSVLKLKSYTVTGNNAAVEIAPELNSIFTRSAPSAKAGVSFHFENAYEFLDQPGEWYLNRDTGDLFYMAREGEDMSAASAIVPNVETLVRLVGKSGSDPVHHVQFEGLVFEYTNFTAPGNGRIGTQGDLEGGRPPAGVFLESADHIKFVRNAFRFMGSTALDIHHRTHNDEVIGNTFTDIGGSGILVGVFSEMGGNGALFNPSDPKELSQNIVISNNYISAGKVTSSTVGILAGYTQGILIEHNEIADMPYTGISLGWGWQDKPSSLRDNVIRYNNIYNVMNKNEDGGAIYTLSQQPNSEIYGNYIHDLDRDEYATIFAVAGIYLDQGSNFFNVHDNVLTDIVDKFQLNMTGSNNKVTNNDGEDRAVMSLAGLEREYWNIVPGHLLHTITGSDKIREWTAPEKGDVRINGTAQKSTSGAGKISISNNGTTVWGPAAVTTDGHASHNLVIRVEKGDKLQFTMDSADIVWNPVIKLEPYPVRLEIEDLTMAEQAEAPTIASAYRTVSVTVKEGTDIKHLAPILKVPQSAVITPASGSVQDFTNPVQYKITDADGVKWKLWTVTVKVESMNGARGFPLNEAIGDSDSWFVPAGATKQKGVGSLIVNTPGSSPYAMYTAKKFGDELLEFTMKNVNEDTGAWPAISIRNKLNSESVLASNNEGYIAVFKHDVIELQRFNQGKRTVFYGDIGAEPGIAGHAVPNTVFEFGKPSLVQFGALNVDEGVRLVLNVNGTKVFDYVDTGAGKITAPGYFSVYAQQGPVMLGNAPVPLRLNEAISESDSWFVPAGATKQKGVGSLTVNTPGSSPYAMYTAKKFGDELLEFNMKNVNEDTGAWPAISIRNKLNSESVLASNNEGYIAVFKHDVIELQRFNQGKRTVFYGDIGAEPGIAGHAVPNTVFEFGKPSLVQFGALNVDEGVRLVLNVNGTKVFDYVDTGAGKITAPGYFSVYAQQGPVMLGNAPVPLRLNEAIGDSDSWFVPAGATKQKGVGSLTVNTPGSSPYAMYTAKKFGDELLEFNMKNVNEDT